MPARCRWLLSVLYLGGLRARPKSPARPWEFYRGRLEQKHALEVLIPDTDERGALHRIIYD
jgi:hypothetical protein